MNNTEQQQAICDAVASGTENLVITARAGSGKTSTALRSLQGTGSKRVLFLAFNKAIADELKGRVPRGVDVHTCHSFGLRVLRSRFNAKVDANKTSKIMRRWLKRGTANDTAAAVSLCKAALCDCEGAVDYVIRKHALEASSAVVWGIMLEAYDSCAVSIDFDDMIWIPNEGEFTVPQYDLVYVDELQDLSPAQLELALMACSGRLIAFGDDRQQCYSWRGAGSDNFAKLVSRLEAETLPLTTSFRCAKSVVREAQLYVPDIEATEDAPEGEVFGCNVNAMRSRAMSGDFVLSRTNAPIVKLALSWLHNGKAVRLAGRDIVQELKHALRQVERALRSGQPAPDDARMCVEAMCEQAGGVPAALRMLERISGERGEGVVCSTVHRAKGLEANRVWVLEDSFKHVSAASDAREESNLRYIAVTRARHSLFKVRGLP